jgi:dihydroflavonol-4-reductase
MILITGATGFIGSRMAQRLKEQDGRLVLLGRLRNEAEQKRAADLQALGLDVHEVDLTTEDLSRYVDGVDLVIHLAAAQHEANQPESYFEKVNVGGTRRLLQASVDAKVRRFVYGSTIGVYGQALEGEIDEHSRVAPDNHYGRTKLAAEQAVRQYGDRLEVAIARISETYGPGDLRLLKLFSGIRKGMFFLIGSGANLHQLVYVDDLIDGLYELGTSEATVGQTLVLAGNEVLSTREMCEHISRAVGRKLRRIRMPLFPFMIAAVGFEQTLGRVGIQPPLHRRRLDFFRKSFFFSPIERNRLLKWRPQVSFAEGTQRTADWYRRSSLLSGSQVAGLFSAGGVKRHANHIEHQDK